MEKRAASVRPMLRRCGRVVRQGLIDRVVDAALLWREARRDADLRFVELCRSDPATAQMVIASLAMGWGAWLLLPGETFDLPLYRAMAAIAREEVWGMGLVCLGGWLAAAIWLDRDAARCRAVRLTGILFLFMGSSFAWADYRGAGCILCFALAHACFWTAWQVRWRREGR